VSRVHDRILYAEMVERLLDDFRADPRMFSDWIGADANEVARCIERWSRTEVGRDRPQFAEAMWRYFEELNPA
jgi:hypothetical protein